jgi:hypothetical protein
MLPRLVCSLAVTNQPSSPPQQANIKSEAYGYAIADATKAIELNPKFIKVRSIPVCDIQIPTSVSPRAHFP